MPFIFQLLGLSKWGILGSCTLLQDPACRSQVHRTTGPGQNIILHRCRVLQRNTHKSIFPEGCLGGMGFYLVTFLWLLKKYRFLQLTICCWLELDMSSPPILVDRSCVPDLRRSKPYSNLTLGLCAHPIRKNVDFRFSGILGNDVSRVSKKCPQDISR